MPSLTDLPSVYIKEPQDLAFLTIPAVRGNLNQWTVGKTALYFCSSLMARNIIHEANKNIATATSYMGMYDFKLETIIRHYIKVTLSIL